MQEMESKPSLSTYNVTIEANEDLGVKTEFLIATYNSICSNARNAAPKEISKELVVVQNAAVKNTFHLRVSNRMVPYLIKAVQDQNQPGYGVSLKSYFHKLQEQIMAQAFSGAGELSFPRFG